ncbi:hypothetical protein Taro_008710 [Colocasia esculenta]|uniref:chlorophyllase n=1 Tax=Colocasia esculenta TaxID=4460 RepID=A0A843TUF7_COLES|nr:hypothetical protein [Colocasia esculenta]
MSAGTRVFEAGSRKVRLLRVEPAGARGASLGEAPPPKPLLVALPEEVGQFPVLVFLHGYLLYNSFYSQLFQHVASHGFIVVAPQLYLYSGADSTEEIKSTASTIDWLETGLCHLLPEAVLPDLTKLAIAGHSRGGKVAFALALGLVAAPTSLKFSAVMGIDPVDGMSKGKQTPPPVLTYVPGSFDLSPAAAMVVGSGLGEVKRNPLFPACAPKGVNHRDFFAECQPPACYFVAEDYGHTDMLDDETPGARGKVTRCTCKNGPERGPMRAFVGGAMVAFMRAYLEGDAADLLAIRDDPGVAPVELSPVTFLLDEEKIAS